MQNRIFGALALASLAIGCVTNSLAQTSSNDAVVATVAFSPPAAGPRYLAFISDLHFGVGRRSDGTWDPTEDFRWPRALSGFLNEISRVGEGRVDLVIVGDFLELWQPPAEIHCTGISADLGCTLDEMEALVQFVVRAHSEEFSILRSFAERGENRLHVIPGNHDSTLLYARVWRHVGQALRSDSGRINLATNGIWVSPDGRVVAEHGHQIGSDLNKYDTWPKIVRRVEGIDYVLRPWGERFVQRLFNEQEARYAIIDNLSPESAGARYRMADRGFGKSTADVARFLAFNLLETSVNQKEALLGPDKSAKQDWNIDVARKLGADLFVNALDPQDPFRKQLTANDEDAAALRAELTAMVDNVHRLSDDDVRTLCDSVAARGEGKLCLEKELGALLEAGLRKLNSQEWYMQKHMRIRHSDFGMMRVFIYGHTHQYEKPWLVELDSDHVVTVVNTGAFQRLINEPGFLRRLPAGSSPQEGLRAMSLDELPPCYSAVLLPPATAGQPQSPEVRAWHMHEDGQGTFVPPDDQRCQ